MIQFCIGSIYTGLDAPPQAFENPICWVLACVWTASLLSDCEKIPAFNHHTIIGIFRPFVCLSICPFHISSGVYGPIVTKLGRNVGDR